MRNGLKKISLAVFFPLLLLALIEAALRITDSFAPPTYLLVYEQDGKRYAATNPYYLQAFFGRTEVPHPPPLWTTLEKPVGVRRVVLFGESAAAEAALARVRSYDPHSRHLRP